jgi:putative CRISPR-associated protein (TIGR02619 family)
MPGNNDHSGRNQPNRPHGGPGGRGGAQRGNSQLTAIPAPYNFVPVSSWVHCPDWGRQVTWDLPFEDGIDRDGQLRVRLGLAYMPKLAWDFSVHELVGHSGAEHLNSPEQGGDYDLADLLFGSLADSPERHLKGRVSCGLAQALGKPQPGTPQTTILNGPKPTYFPNYLEQQTDGSSGKLQGREYATCIETPTNKQPRLRGFKRYPVRADAQVQKLSDQQQENKKVQVTLHPLPANTRFQGSLQFHNLRPVELGALIWALTWGNDPALRHALGMGVSARDRVVLFSSDTDEGRCCAGAVDLYLHDQLPGIDCQVRVIDDLQVHDADAFRRRGVLGFTQAVLHEIDSFGAPQCRLNPTGGFKSLVPYTVLIGMIKGVLAQYIFEQSSTVIDLPMMPVEFALARLEPLRAQIERIERENYVPQADLRACVPHDEWQALGPLFEEEGDQLTLSPVGLLLWDQMNHPQTLVPFLSRRAFDDLFTLQQIEGAKPEVFLQRVARDHEQLQQATHKTWPEGLRWLKPGQHTRDRYLVSVEGWRLLVWRMVDHQEYDKMLDNNVGSDKVARTLLEQRRAKHEPFVRMEFYGAGR